MTKNWILEWTASSKPLSFGTVKTRKGGVYSNLLISGELQSIRTNDYGTIATFFPNKQGLKILQGFDDLSDELSLEHIQKDALKADNSLLLKLKKQGDSWVFAGEPKEGPCSCELKPAYYFDNEKKFFGVFYALISISSQ